MTTTEGVESAEMEEDDFPEFTLAEIMELQRIYKESGEESQAQNICEEIASRFSCSEYRDGQSAIKWEQVQKWFQDKQKKYAVEFSSSPVDLEEFEHSNESTLPISLQNLVRLSKEELATERSLKPKAERVAELSELVFEALSAKDSAWYDVAAFLNYRVLYTGELEVRVRFAGFNHDQDEWVNVRSAVRERSIPLEPSECHKVKVGDLVLCYRVKYDYALYSDAYVVNIQRTMHDSEGCTCTFVVRFEYDNAEGQVQLSEMCGRPSK